jgi:hypothetical protein
MMSPEPDQVMREEAEIELPLVYSLLSKRGWLSPDRWNADLYSIGAGLTRAFTG